MPRTPVWQTIAATVEDEITAGHYSEGDKLPTEAALAARFGVNRHTVRRALVALGEKGLTHSRRGAGTFVAFAPTEYPLGKRVRFHRSIEATGRLPKKLMLRIETRPADAQEAKALKLKQGAPVILYEGLSLSGQTPIAHFISCFPTARVPHIGETFQTVTSVTEALRLNGIADFTRASTRLTAAKATATQALHLRLNEGDPLLHSESLNLCPEGRPIEHGHTWFAGDRVTLTVTS